MMSLLPTQRSSKKASDPATSPSLAIQPAPGSPSPDGVGVQTLGSPSLRTRHTTRCSSNSKFLRMVGSVAADTRPAKPVAPDAARSNGPIETALDKCTGLNLASSPGAVPIGT